MFALGFCVELLSGRVPYDLGFAIGLGSVLALLRGRLALALVLALLTSAASPVAGAFLALAGLAYALAAWREGHQGRDRGLALAAAALLPIVVLALAFPEGGYEPFAPSAFWPALAGVLLIALLLPQGTLTPRARRTVRLGAALYALALIGAFALETPVGGNATRLAALLAAPLLAGVLWSRHRRRCACSPPCCSTGCFHTDRKTYRRSRGIRRSKPPTTRPCASRLLASAMTPPRSSRCR